MWLLLRKDGEGGEAERKRGDKVDVNAKWRVGSGKEGQGDEGEGEDSRMEEDDYSAGAGREGEDGSGCPLQVRSGGDGVCLLN